MPASSITSLAEGHWGAVGSPSSVWGRGQGLCCPWPWGYGVPRGQLPRLCSPAPSLEQQGEVFLACRISQAVIGF